MRTRIWAILAFLITGNLFGQNNTNKYNVFINLALSPGHFYSYNRRMYMIEDGEVRVLNLIKTIGDEDIFKNLFGKRDTTIKKEKKEIIYVYDTTHFALSALQEKEIIQTISSIQCMDNFVHDPRWIDGLRFIFSCRLDSVKHYTWISNVYNEKIAVFIEIINSYVPKEWQIWYDKNELLNASIDCN